MRTSQDCNGTGCTLRCAKDKQRINMSNLTEKRCRGGKEKSYQPLFPLFLSWSNVHQTKKHRQKLNHHCFTSKGMAVVITRLFFFLISSLSRLTCGSHLQLTSRACGRAQSEDKACRQGSSGEALVWSYCWGLRSILTRFHFFLLIWDLILHLFYSCCIFFLKKIYISSVIVSNVPTSSCWDYTYYIISRGLWIIIH